MTAPEETIERLAMAICEMQGLDPEGWCGHIGDRRTVVEEARDDVSLVFGLIRPGDDLGNGLVAVREGQRDD